MATKQNALRYEIAGKREEISEDIARLEDMLRRRYEAATDIGGFYRSRPLTIAGSVLAIGLVIGLIVGFLTD
ncbi:MAG: hypothetical protein ACOX87_06005 [Chloroflexota bacterium]